MLNQILQRRKADVERAKAQHPIEKFLDVGQGFPSLSLAATLARPQLNIVAEIKYRSPSPASSLGQSPPEHIAADFGKHGAAAISVLTEPYLYGGSLQHLERVARALHSDKDEEEPGTDCPPLPLLRKDLIYDRYQVAETRAYGASAFVLLAAILDRALMRELRHYGQELGLEALVEVHDARELEQAVEAGSKLISVSNRELNTLEVDLNTSFSLARRLEGERGYLLVSDGGLREPTQLSELRDAGFSGFIIGTAFLESASPGEKLQELISGVKVTPG